MSSQDAKRQKEIWRAINDQENINHRCADLVGDLYQKLGPVIRPELQGGPESNKVTQAGAATLNTIPASVAVNVAAKCEVATRIDSKSLIIAETNKMLSEILDRLEV